MPEHQEEGLGQDSNEQPRGIGGEIAANLLVTTERYPTYLDPTLNFSPYDVNTLTTNVVTSQNACNMGIAFRPIHAYFVTGINAIVFTLLGASALNRE